MSSFGESLWCCAVEDMKQKESPPPISSWMKDIAEWGPATLLLLKNVWRHPLKSLYHTRKSYLCRHKPKLISLCRFSITGDHLVSSSTLEAKAKCSTCKRGNHCLTSDLSQSPPMFCLQFWTQVATFQVCYDQNPAWNEFCYFILIEENGKPIYILDSDEWCKFFVLMARNVSSLCTCIILSSPYWPTSGLFTLFACECVCGWSLQRPCQS